MTYNHDKAKVTCPECAREVERLRAEIELLRKAVDEQKKEIKYMDALIDGYHFNLDC